jgi:hypothetical protein
VIPSRRRPSYQCRHTSAGRGTARDGDGRRVVRE